MLFSIFEPQNKSITYLFWRMQQTFDIQITFIKLVSQVRKKVVIKD